MQPSYYMHPSYAHQTPYLHAADVHELPYLGGPEDRIKHAFIDAYAYARRQLTSREFAQTLRGKYVSANHAMAHVNAHLEAAEQTFHAHTLPTLERVAHGGAASARLAYWGMTKAEPLRRRRIVPMPRKRFRGPRLHGLRQSPVPPPHGTHPADPHHLAAARAQAANLVTHITRTQRAEIRTVVAQGISRGINVDDTAARIANIVGLHPRWQRAVLNMHRRMLDNDVPRRVANARTQQYADDLLDKRGTMIARTELIRAMNAGRLAGWHDLADQGLIDPDKSIKQWSGNIDNRICPECEYLADPSGDGKGGVQVVGIDTLFDTEYGPIAHPPAHPHCRCTIVLHPVVPGGTHSTEGVPEQLTQDLAVVADPDLLQLRNVLP